MNGQKIFAILLIVAGALALGYGGFSYTQESTKAQIGSLQLSVDEKKQVSIPMWAGISSIVFGGLLLVWGRKS